MSEDSEDDCSSIHSSLLDDEDVDMPDDDAAASSLSQLSFVKRSSSSFGSTNLQCCPFCDYHSVHQNLKKHVQYHLEESSHTCSRCSYSVGSASALSKHVKNHHKDTISSQPSPASKLLVNSFAFPLITSKIIFHH